MTVPSYRSSIRASGGAKPNSAELALFPSSRSIGGIVESVSKSAATRSLVTRTPSGAVCSQRAPSRPNTTCSVVAGDGHLVEALQRRRDQRRDGLGLDGGALRHLRIHVQPSRQPGRCRPVHDDVPPGHRSAQGLMRRRTNTRMPSAMKTPGWIITAARNNSAISALADEEEVLPRCLRTSARGNQRILASQPIERVEHEIAIAEVVEETIGHELRIAVSDDHGSSRAIGDAAHRWLADLDTDRDRPVAIAPGYEAWRRATKHGRVGGRPAARPHAQQTNGATAFLDVFSGLDRSRPRKQRGGIQGGGDLVLRAEIRHHRREHLATAQAGSRDRARRLRRA